MSSNRQQQTGGGAGPGPGSSSSTGGTTNANGATSVTLGGNDSANVNNSPNVVPSRTLAAAGEGLLVPGVAVQSPRSLAPLSRSSSSSSGTSRKRPLHQAPLYNGLLNSYEDKSNDFVW